MLTLNVDQFTREEGREKRESIGGRNRGREKKSVRESRGRCESWRKKGRKRWGEGEKRKVKEIGKGV